MSAPRRPVRLIARAHCRRTTLRAIAVSSQAVRSGSEEAKGDHSSRMRPTSIVSRFAVNKVIKLRRQHEFWHIEQKVHILRESGPTAHRCRQPTDPAWRIDRAANASESASTARTKSSENSARSVSMACDELPDGLLRDGFLFFGVLLGPGRLGAFRRIRAPARSRPWSDRNCSAGVSAESRDFLKDHFRLTGEFDGKVHRQLFNQCRHRSIIATFKPESLSLAKSVGAR